MPKNFGVFLDRDGVINEEVDNLHELEDLKILPRVPQTLKLLNKFKIPAIVVTNQPVVARGWLTEVGVKKVHAEIEKILAKNGARIDKFYFCPHHPEANLPKYCVICNCRKPATGLFEKAAKDFGIDLKKSYIIGDSFRDIEAGEKIGATTIFVQTGSGDLGDSAPNFSFDNLYEAVKFILEKEGLRK